MSVLSFERYPVDADRSDSFEALVGDLVAKMRVAQGVLWADTTRASDDDPSYIVLSEWRTQADLEAWTSGAEAARFGEEVDVHLRSEPTRRRFTGA